jgi:hypothetical protein
MTENCRGTPGGDGASRESIASVEITKASAQFIGEKKDGEKSGGESFARECGVSAVISAWAQDGGCSFAGP